MPIRTRIILVCLLPLLGLVWFAGTMLVDRYHSVEAAKVLVGEAVVAERTSALIHELQKERGISAGFLSVSTGDFGQALASQRQRVDAARTAHQEINLVLGSGGPGVERKLAELRLKVDRREMSAAEAVAAFSTIVNSLLADIDNMEAIASDGRVVRLVGVYLSLLRARELAGLERAVGMEGFSSGKFSPDLFQKFVKLSAAEDVYLSEVREYLEKERLHDILVKFDLAESGDLRRCREIAASSAFGNSDDKVLPEQWFEKATTRINHLKEVGDALSARLKALTEASRRELANLFYWHLFEVLAVVSLTLAAAFGAITSLVNAISRLVANMLALAGGNTAIEAYGETRRDEVGDMARAVSVFRENAIARARLQAEADHRAEEVRLRRLHLENLIEKFRCQAQELLSGVTAKMAEMRKAAESLNVVAGHTTETASGVSGATGAASGNVRAAALSSEEVARAIQEISAKVAETTRVVADANAQAGAADHKVSNLSEGARRIGEVLSLIGEIADRTKLLALNATIESARAGQYGRGFSVVADEVKALAEQTARATEEIGSHVMAIRSSTGDAVGAIQSISKVIHQISETTDFIAGAVDQQTAATEEIKRSVREAACGTAQVATSSEALSAAVRETHDLAAQVLDGSVEVSEIAARLREEVEGFLKDVAA